MAMIEGVHGFDPFIKDLTEAIQKETQRKMEVIIEEAHEKLDVEIRKVLAVNAIKIAKLVDIQSTRDRLVITVINKEV
jgi:glycerophosphoryl diester phosphodiesterase